MTRQCDYLIAQLRSMAEDGDKASMPGGGSGFLIGNLIRSKGVGNGSRSDDSDQERHLL